jgi:flagellin-specific chaperone FliS
MDQAYSSPNSQQNFTPNAAIESGFGGSPLRQKLARDAYRREEFMHLSPEQIVHKLMSLGIQGCRKKDKTQAVRAVNALILALDFKYADVSMGFFRLYDYCKMCIYKGDLLKAIKILDELRTTWAEAFHLKEAA